MPGIVTSSPWVCSDNVFDCVRDSCASKQWPWAGVTFWTNGPGGALSQNIVAMFSIRCALIFDTWIGFMRIATDLKVSLLMEL